MACNSTRVNVGFYTWDADTADANLGWERSGRRKGSVDTRLNRSQQCVCPSRKEDKPHPEVHQTYHSITSQSNQVIILLYLAPMWPLLKYCVRLSAP